MALINAVTSALGTIYEWIGGFINELTNSTSGSEGALVGLLPLFAVGIAISVVLLGRFFAQYKSRKKPGKLHICYANQT